LTFAEIAASPGGDGRPLYSDRQAAHRAIVTALRNGIAAEAGRALAADIVRMLSVPGEGPTKESVGRLAEVVERLYGDGQQR
jgi:hypothetical protein